MPENVQNTLSEIVSMEVVKRLTKDGICIIVQSGDSEFRFVPKRVAEVDLVKLAGLLLNSGCAESVVENILEKIEKE